MTKKITLSRILLHWILSSIGMFLLTLLLPGITVDNLGAAFITTAVIGLLNAFLWPIFIRFTLPITVVTLGFATLLLNGVIVLLASWLLAGFSVTNIWSATFFAVGLTVITTLIYQMLVINDDDTYYRNVIKRQMKKYKTNAIDKIPGVVFLQIDGLAYNVLYRAMSAGDAPTLAKWLRSGKYRLEKWETTWSSQTGASQAGILMGSNKDIPAFRWLEKDKGKIMTFGRPRDVKEIEKRLSTHTGLLSNDGASRGNLFSGDAAYTLLTLSTVTNPDRKHFGQDYYSYFASPYNFIRTILFVISDIIKEFRSALDQKHRDVTPRLETKKKWYPFLRAWTTVIQRDILVQTLIADMYKGRPVIYADFVGYDEVSHHSGIERYQTMDILRDIDKQIARLSFVASDTSRPYYLIVLSDHGQTQGATFYQRSGFTLKQLVQRLCNKKIAAETNNEEDSMYLHAAIMEASASKNFAAKILSSLRKHRVPDNKNKKIDEEIVVIASGCLGLIYFNKFHNRATYEEIEKEYPGLIDKLRKQQFIGFLLVNSKKYGGMVMGKNSIYYLSKNKTVGRNPLEPFGLHASEKIKMTHESKYVADIMINSFYDEKVDEVASFEEQIGSHGGMGGKQSYPFIFFPRKWDFPKEVVGAENLHKVMKQWMENIGQKQNIKKEL